MQNQEETLFNNSQAEMGVINNQNTVEESSNFNIINNQNSNNGINILGSLLQRQIIPYEKNIPFTNFTQDGDDSSSEEEKHQSQQSSVNIVNSNPSYSKSSFKNPIPKPKKPTTSKYQDDIMHILKYAEENNPMSLIFEVCAILKWELPQVESFEMLENNLKVYKSNVKVKHFQGEGVGITKKISRSK
jgi:hypothetical protein